MAEAGQDVALLFIGRSKGIMLHLCRVELEHIHWMEGKI